MVDLPSRIIVIRAGALGDVLLTLPALQALRERYPDATLQVVGYPGTWEVAGDLADEVVSIDHPRFASLYIVPSSPQPPSPLTQRVPGEGGECARISLPFPLRGGGARGEGAKGEGPGGRGYQAHELRPWLSGADLVIAWTVRDPTPSLLATGVSAIHASPYPPPGVHAAAWLLHTLEFPHRRADVLRRAAAIGAAWRHDTITDHRARCLIHPGAGAAWKRWPAERFAAVADSLSALGHDVAIIEGPADAPAVAEVLRWTHRSYPVIREPSLRRLASTLAGAGLYIGNDSGVTHLAALAGAPTIALFGPTDPASWTPLGRVILLRRCLASSSAQGLVRVCDDPRCMEGISVDDVLSAAASAVSA